MASRGKRALMSCGIGCLAVLILVVGSCVTFVYWLNRPGELLEPDLLVGDDTTGYVTWTLRLEDPGTAEFTRAFLDSVQRIQSGSRPGVPPALNRILSGIEEYRQEQKMKELFPTVVAWTLHPGYGPEDDLNLFSVSIEKAGNRMVFFDWLFAWILSKADDSDVGVVPHNGEKIYQFEPRRGPSVAVFIRSSDLFFTSDLSTAKQAVDRLRGEGAGKPAPPELRELFDRLQIGTPFRGAVSNRHGEMERLWDRFLGGKDPGGRVWEGIVGVGLSGSFVEGGGVHARVEILCDGPSRAAGKADYLVEQFRNWLRPSGLEFDLDSSVQDRWITIDLDCRDVVSQLEDQIRIKVRGSNIQIGG